MNQIGRVCLVVFTLHGILAVFPRELRADVDVRECIVLTSAANKSWKVAANSGATTLGTLTFNTQTASSYVVNGSVVVDPGSWPGANVRYTYYIDGVQAGGNFLRRTPDAFPSTQLIRGFFPGLSAGQHSIAITVQNEETISGHDVYYHLVWITPLILDATEVNRRGENNGPTTVNGTWTTIVQTTIVPPPTSAMNFFTLTPCRVLDTRNTTRLTGPTTYPVAGLCGIPLAAPAVTFNTTAVTPNSHVDIAGYPGNEAATNTNVVSADAAAIRAGEAVLPLATDGSGTLGVTPTFTGGGTEVDLLLDATGYFLTNKMIYLGLYTEINGGNPHDEIEYRILQGTTPIADFFGSVPTVISDGMHAAVIDAAPFGNSDTYTVQARTTSGSSVTFGITTLFAQTMPGTFNLWQGGASNVTVPADQASHVIASSGFIPLGSGASSVGALDATNGHGFANVTYSGPYNQASQLRFGLIYESDGTNQEVGTTPVHSSGSISKLEAQSSDWELLGLQVGGQYRLDLTVASACTDSNSLGFKSVFFQVIGLPDPIGILPPYVCNPGHTNRCCQNVPGCTVYTCTAGLSEVTNNATAPCH